MIHLVRNKEMKSQEGGGERAEERGREGERGGQRQIHINYLIYLTSISRPDSPPIKYIDNTLCMTVVLAEWHENSCLVHAREYL